MVEPDIPLNEGIDLINRNDPSITKFELKHIEGRRVTEDQIRALFRGLRQNTHVRKLDLHWTPRELRRTVCIGLLPELLHENSSIEYLRFPRKMMNAELLPSVDDLCNNNNMTVKDLGINSCDIRGRDGGEMIGRLIRNNRRIMSINLDGNNLGPAGAARIAAALGNENCALKTLYLDRCGIGDEGVDALCTALHVNSLLETFRFYHNQITDEGYRALARSLPFIIGLKEIRFEWEQLQVSASVLQQMLDSLHKNWSLQHIASNVGILSKEQWREWETCCAFVGARNKMKSHLDEVCIVAAREGRVTPMPVPMAHLLQWCHRPLPWHWHREDVEAVQVSLVYLVLRSNVGKIAGWEHYN